jgi:hypothetical protein
MRKHLVSYEETFRCPADYVKGFFYLPADTIDIHSPCDVTCMQWTLIRLNSSWKIQVSSCKHIHHFVAL